MFSFLSVFHFEGRNKKFKNAHIQFALVPPLDFYDEEANQFLDCLYPR